MDNKLIPVHTLCMEKDLAKKMHEDDILPSLLKSGQILLRWLLAYLVILMFSVTDLKDAVIGFPDFSAMAAYVFGIVFACQLFGTFLAYSFLVKCGMITKGWFLRTLQGIANPVLMIVGVVIIRVLLELPDQLKMSDCLTSDNATYTQLCLHTIGGAIVQQDTTNRHTMEELLNNLNAGRFIIFILVLLPSLLHLLMPRWKMSLKYFVYTGLFSCINSCEIISLLQIAYENQRCSNIVLAGNSIMFLAVFVFNAFVCYLSILPMYLGGDDEENNFKLSKKYFKCILYASFIGFSIPVCVIRLNLYFEVLLLNSMSVSRVSLYMFYILAAKDIMLGIICLYGLTCDIYHSKKITELLKMKLKILSIFPASYIQKYSELGTPV